MWDEKNEKNKGSIYRRGLVSSSIEYHIFMSKYYFLIFYLMDVQASLIEDLGFVSSFVCSLLAAQMHSSNRKFVSYFSFGKYLHTLMHKLNSLSQSSLLFLGLDVQGY